MVFTYRSRVCYSSYNKESCFDQEYTFVSRPTQSQCRSPGQSPEPLAILFLSGDNRCATVNWSYQFSNFNKNFDKKLSLAKKKNQQQMQSKVHPQNLTEWCNQGMLVGEKKKVIFPSLTFPIHFPLGRVPGVSPGWRPGAYTCVTYSRCKVIEGSSWSEWRSLTDRLTRNFSCYWRLYFLEKLWQHFHFFFLAFCLSNNTVPGKICKHFSLERTTLPSRK